MPCSHTMEMVPVMGCRDVPTPQCGDAPISGCRHAPILGCRDVLIPCHGDAPILGCRILHHGVSWYPNSSHGLQREFGL